MHQNIPELQVFFGLIFSDNKMLFFGLSFILCYNCHEEMVFLPPNIPDYQNFE